MKRTTIWIGAAVMLLGIFAGTACKKAEVETATLTVIVSAGVTGSPVAGEHTVTVGDDQAYSFSLGAGYEKLTVLLDGIAVAASGTFTVTGDQTLQAYSDDNIQYRLTVTLTAGVNGTPLGGSYTYTKGATVPYHYALADGYKGLSVQLDDAEVAASGTLTMTKDFKLEVSAGVKYIVLGSWNLSEYYADGSSFGVVLTCSGTADSGTVTDSEGGGGTFAYTNDTVTFALKFPEVTYEYTGTFSDADTMSGTCKRYQSADNVITGTWKAIRITSGVAATQPGASQNKSRN
jgi:hypothetical protein